MEKRIDAKGMACPKPVVMAKKAMEESNRDDVVVILVDNEIAAVNLRKLAVSQKADYAVQKLAEKEYEVKITIKSQNAGTEQTESPAQEEMPGCAQPAGNTVVAIGSNLMGEGDEELGRILLEGFVFALTGLEQLPSAVLLYNKGAYLSCEGSRVLEDLRELERQGVEILTCGTCLQHYGLKEKLAAGKVTNMYGIVEHQAKAGKILRP